MVLAPSSTPKILIPLTSYSPGESMVNASLSLSSGLVEIKMSLFRRGAISPDSLLGGSIKILIPPASKRKQASPYQEIVIIKKSYQIFYFLTNFYLMLTLPDMNTAENIMQSLAAKMPREFDLPKIGEVVEGRVIKKSARNLYIDLGIWGIGIVYGIEFINAQDIIKNLKIGSQVFAKIVEVQNESGFRELSLAEAKAQKSWDLIRELKKTNQAVTTKILSVNRGGLIVEISGIAGFLPVSQLASEHYPRVEGGDKNKILEELSKFVGLEFKIRVLDFDVKENKLIVSERAAEEEHLKRAIERYKIGDVLNGSVSGVVDWGVFVKWPMEEEMLEGLIHISELDWQLVEN